MQPPPPPPPPPPVLQSSYPLPEEIVKMNEKVEMLLHHRKEMGMQRMNAYDDRIQWVGNMLKESNLHRGHVWRLKEAGDKDQASDWQEFQMVLTGKGRLMMEPNNSELLATSFQRKIILDFDMTTVVRHDAIDIKCLGGAAMQLIFRVQKGTKRTNLYLYVAFGENSVSEYEDWWKVMRKFSWRADDINTDHLGATKWTTEEKVISDQIEEVFRAVRCMTCACGFFLLVLTRCAEYTFALGWRPCYAWPILQRYELRKIMKVQRWWRRLRQQRANDAKKRVEMLETHEQLSRMAYLLQHQGPIGEQGEWNHPHRVFTFSRGKFQKNYDLHAECA